MQRLNREGVEAVRKHNYSKAEKLFYKAYLLDPDDAFTLNNLGFISEMQGAIGPGGTFLWARRQQSSDAVVDIASARQIKGQSDERSGRRLNGPLEINHANVEAVRLLNQGRAPEADMLLGEVLKSTRTISIPSTIWVWRKKWRGKRRTPSLLSIAPQLVGPDATADRDNKQNVERATS